MFPVPPPPPNAPVRPTLSPDLELNVGAVAASGSILFPASLDPALRHLFDAVAMRVSPFVDRGIAGRFSTNNTDVIGTIQAPVTLVFGGKDVIVAPPVQKRLAELFPKARVVVFPDSGHAMFLDEAARFNALLAAGPCTASP
jgi:pimeloyl-ACP methyl ester carboxylesterase